LSKNNSELLVLILTGKITLSLFKKKASLLNVEKIHEATGKSIIHYLALSNRYEFASDAIEWLKEEFDININIVDNEGNTPLFGASQVGNVELIEYLFISGADFNHINNQKESALFSVFETYDEDVTQSLLRNGTNVDIENIDGYTILDMCSYEEDHEEFSEIVELLTEYKFKNSTEQTVKIYSERNINKFLKDNTDKESPVIPFYNKMLNSGQCRILASVSVDTLTKVDELVINFPNFSEIIDHVKEQICLSLLSEDPYFSMKPLLMLGGPGVGKTRFNIELSKIIGAEIVVIDGGNISGGFIIGGNSPAWINGSPGKVAKQLIYGNTANPIVQLDEIDKMSSQQGFDPFGPLYSLLEHKTASDFIDEYVGLPMDCSYLNWISTANNLSSIPDAILSRFLVKKVPNPSKKQMVNITKSVYSDIINDPKNPWGHKFDNVLDDSVILSLSSQTPREIHRMLLAAMGKVALKAHKEKRDKDSIIGINSDDIRLSMIGKKTTMGMV
jgi:ATP-dependent Lon protease